MAKNLEYQLSEFIKEIESETRRIYGPSREEQLNYIARQQRLKEEEERQRQRRIDEERRRLEKIEEKKKEEKLKEEKLKQQRLEEKKKKTIS